MKRHNKAAEKETVRHNQVTELQTGQSLLETNRHNVASEQLQDKSISTQADTARYAADTAAAATMYAADQSASATMYAADQNAAVQRERIAAEKAIADLNSATSRINTLYSTNAQNQRAEADRLSREAINAANNALKIGLDANQTIRDNAKNDIERAKAQAEKAYKQGRIKVDTFNAIVKAADTALDYLKSLGIVSKGGK